MRDHLRPIPYAEYHPFYNGNKASVCVWENHKLENIIFVFLSLTSWHKHAAEQTETQLSHKGGSGLQLKKTGS